MGGCWSYIAHNITQGTKSKSTAVYTHNYSSCLLAFLVLLLHASNESTDRAFSSQYNTSCSQKTLGHVEWTSLRQTEMLRSNFSADYMWISVVVTNFICNLAFL